jgi:hypothetical protein
MSVINAARRFPQQPVVETKDLPENLNGRRRKVKAGVPKRQVVCS